MLQEAWRNENKFHLVISPVTLKRLIKRLSVGKGHDGLHTNYFKRLSDDMLKILCNFMNACYKHCSTPIEILLGDINPAIKDTKGNSTVSGNYRPVMQSSCLLKLFEFHILDILEEKLFFNARQFGFKKGTSTTDACLLLKETVNKYIQNKRKSYGMFIDLSKAFDNVNHFKLGKLLIKRKIPPDIILFLLYYLRNQKARVLWKNEKGEYFRIEKGVRQGGILSPLLFKLYIDNILELISKKNVGCRFGTVRMNVLAYADDLVLLSDSIINLNNLYKILDEEIKHLQLKINESKSKCMIFRKTRDKVEKELKICENNFEIVPNYKYLGHMIEYDLSDNVDVKYRLNLFFAKTNWLLKNFKDISMEAFLFLFNSYCVPDYGLSLWNVSNTFSTQFFKSFEIAFGNTLKKMYQVPRSTSSHLIANIFRILLLRHHVLFVQMRYFKRIFNSFNVLIKISSLYIRDGYLYRSLFNMTYGVYNINFASYSIDILKSRVLWVQGHEPIRGSSI